MPAVFSVIYHNSSSDLIVIQMSSNNNTLSPPNQLIVFPIQIIIYSCTLKEIGAIGMQRRYHTSPTLKEVTTKFMCACSVVSAFLRPHGLYPARLLCPWDSPGKNTGVSCHALLQGIFPTQRSNPHLLMSPALAGRFLTTRLPPPGKPLIQPSTRE